MPPKRRDPSKKTSSARPPTLKTGLTKEKLSKETLSKEMLSKETLSKEMLSKETLSKEQSPKGKEPSKKTSSARPRILINGLTKEQLSREQMIEHIAHLREELDRVREETKAFKQERDMYHSMNAVAAMRMKKVRGKLKAVERAAEEDDVRHRAEKEVHEKKLKHLLCEHQDSVSEVKEARLVTADMLQKEQDELQDELSNSMRTIMADMQNPDYENEVKELELKLQEEMAAARDKLDREYAEYTAKCEEILRKKKEGMSTESLLIERNLEWETSIVAVPEENEKIIRDAVGEAAENFTLALKQTNEAIDKFTKENPELKREVNKITQALRSALQEKLQLEERLTQVRKKITVWEKMQKYTEKMPQIPKMKVLKDLRTDHAVLEKEFRKVELERDELLASFEQTVLRKQQEADLPNILMERKVQAVKEHLEEVQAQLQSAASAPNMDHIGLTNKEEMNQVSASTLYGSEDERFGNRGSAGQDVNLELDKWNAGNQKFQFK